MIRTVPNTVPAIKTLMYGVDTALYSQQHQRTVEVVENCNYTPTGSFREGMSILRRIHKTGLLQLRKNPTR